MEFIKYVTVKTDFIGRPLKSSEEGGQKLTKFKALAMLSSDALSSVAYGTEQIVLVLTTLSAAAIWYSLPIAAFVLVLLISLTLSYRQIFMLIQAVAVRMWFLARTWVRMPGWSLGARC